MTQYTVFVYKHYSLVKYKKETLTKKPESRQKGQRITMHFYNKYYQTKWSVRKYANVKTSEMWNG